MSIEKYVNDHGKVDKPKELLKIIPEYVTECALYMQKSPEQPCSDTSDLNAIAAALQINSNDPNKIVSEAKKATDCKTEKCVIEKMSDVLGKQRVSAVINTKFKVDGPVDNSLLNNFNIDETLKQFNVKFTNFFPYNFNMLNYREYRFVNGHVEAGPDTLETIPISGLINDFKCAGCIINTDTYQGNGKHWMALFADWRDPNAATVEFFNSSGNAPTAPWVLWMERSRDFLVTNGIKIRKIRDASGFDRDLLRVSNKRHQQSKTECGVYSLFYIYARLNRIPPEYFMDNFIPDQLIFEFRQHLFNGDGKFLVGEITGGGNNIYKFDWDKYAEQVRIKWEATP